MSKRITPETPKAVESIRHYGDKRTNIPSAEYQSLVEKEDKSPIRKAYERRNRDLDPQLVWRGKDEQDESDLVVYAPPIYIQENVHPKALIADLLKQKEAKIEQGTLNLFSDFNGLPEGADKTDFYQHDANWTNRMILGDSLQVMASLAEREGLRGQVQCIYMDPPYGIKFNSNFQWSTTDRGGTGNDAKDKISREPEMVKAFRDTWRDGIHSYLGYLRDRLTAARDLLSDSGSIFLQIGDENVHRVRALMDEVFGEENFVATIAFQKTSSATSSEIPSTYDTLIWFARNRQSVKYRSIYREKSHHTQGASEYAYMRSSDLLISRLTKDQLDDPEIAKYSLRVDNLTSQSGGESTRYTYRLGGRTFAPGSGGWKTSLSGMQRLDKANRLYIRSTSMNYIRYLSDFPVLPLGNYWEDTVIAGWGEGKVYVVQTARRVVERCLLMTTDPGDLVLDPTCGSGTTAYVAEQWGRRWITIDTSRVALALARSRGMGARYPFYLLADSKDGQIKEGDVTRTAPSTKETFGNLRHGFVYERVPHITLKSIANNAEIDVIHEKWQPKLDALIKEINSAFGAKFEEWEVPVRSFSRAGGLRAGDPLHQVTPERQRLIDSWWDTRIARQKEIDASIAAKAEYEFLYDKPYEDKKKVRVAGPFTVESLSPHRTISVDENDDLSPEQSASAEKEATDFVSMILENLRVAGVQQAHKQDKIDFIGLTPWPGCYICAEGRYEESGIEKRAGIFIGPEFGTVSRPDLVEAAREAGEADFDVLITCAFNYDAHSTEFEKLGRIPVLKARMNADLHMAGELKNTGKGNLFVIFGEPDIDIQQSNDQFRVKINGVDVFDPSTGEVRSDGPDGIACWFLDSDYNGESFFVRHAYFLGANDPYKSLKTTLKAEIDEDSWATLHSPISRPFDRPSTGRIAVKVINHLGDEVMKVFHI